MGLPQFLRIVTSDGIPSRLVFAAASFLAIAINFGLRSIPNLAVVAMVNFSAIPRADGSAGSPQESCFNLSAIDMSNASGEGDPLSLLGNGSLDASSMEGGGEGSWRNQREDGPFEWDEEIQQLIISSFYWGYLVLQIPGGRWSEMYGGKRLVSICTFATALFTMIVPLAARIGYVAFIATRIAMGISQAVIFPALTVLIARWSPPAELSRLNACVKTGSMFGVFAVTPSGGWLISVFGWESVFYIFGIICVVFGVMWEFLVYDSPDDHPRISEAERKFITEAIGSHSVGNKKKMKDRKVPWKGILTSGPVWAATFGSSMLAWGYMTLASLMPVYMKIMLGFDIRMNGLINGLPSLGRCIFGIGYSCLCDLVIKKAWISRTNVRKFSCAIPGIFRVVVLFLMPFLGCDAFTSVIITVVSGILAGATWSSTGPALIEMGPNFVGTVYGVFNMGFTIVAMTAPVVSALFIKGNQTFETWANVFRLSGGLAAAGVLIFCVFGSAEEQPWNRYDGDEEDEESVEEPGAVKKPPKRTETQETTLNSL